MFTRVSKTSTYLVQLRFLQKDHAHLFHSWDVQAHRVRQAVLASHAPELPHSHLCLPWWRPKKPSFTNWFTNPDSRIWSPEVESGSHKAKCNWILAHKPLPQKSGNTNTILLENSTEYHKDVQGVWMGQFLLSSAIIRNCCGKQTGFLYFPFLADKTNTNDALGSRGTQEKNPQKSELNIQSHWLH